MIAIIWIAMAGKMRANYFVGVHLGSRDGGLWPHYADDGLTQRAYLIGKSCPSPCRGVAKDR